MSGSLNAILRRENHMKLRLLAGLVWAALASPVFAGVSPKGGALNGTWNFEYSCAGATGPYADRCAAGERDHFALSIAQNSGRFCGWYEATIQMGGHVDAGDLSDWTFTRTSDQTFHVHFHLQGTIGEAVIRSAGNELHWRELTEQPYAEIEPAAWSVSPPKSATLVRQRPGRVGHPAVCED